MANPKPNPNPNTNPNPNPNPNHIHTYIYTAIYVRRVAEIVYVEVGATCRQVVTPSECKSAGTRTSTRPHRDRIIRHGSLIIATSASHSGV